MKEQTHKIIVLAGFMGTGKTTVGKELAGKLNLEFVDLDSVIERREGKKISKIFEEDGETYFRQLEKQVVKDCSEGGPRVLATGGGAIIDPENLEALKSNGVVILLEADTETIIKRTKDDTYRPLLLVQDPKKRIEELLESRRSFYNKADYKIDTSAMGVNEVVNQILGILADE